jgi:hypothetical protein
MGPRRPGGVSSILPLRGITKTLKEAWKREVRSEMMDTRENGGTDDFDDVLSLRRQPLLQHPREGSKLLPHICIPESEL